MSFIYTGFGPIIEYQFRLSEDQLRSLIADLVLVRLQKETDPLLHKRLYKAIRHAILDGSLRPIAACPFTGSGGRAENVSQHNFNSLRTIAG